MKLSTLVLLILLGTIGYKIYQTQTAPPPPPPVAAATTATAAPATPLPAAPRPERWPRSALVVLHGKVADHTPDGFYVAVSPVENAQGGGRHGNQGLREAQQKILDQDRQLFGPVMTMENGTPLHESRDIPPAISSGMVVLKDYPNEKEIAPGTPINVVAAPLGNENYTVRFNTTEEKAGGWLRNYKGPMDP